MTQPRYATRFRVDWFEGDVAKVFSFVASVRAWDKYVEGVSNGLDEVVIYQFDGGRDSAVLLARHYFRKATYGTQTTDKSTEASLRRQQEKEAGGFRVIR